MSLLQQRLLQPEANADFLTMRKFVKHLKMKESVWMVSVEIATEVFVEIGDEANATEVNPVATDILEEKMKTKL